MFPGWTNLDKIDMSGYLETLRHSGDISTWPEHQQKMADHARNGAVSCSVLDMRYDLHRFADSSIDAIYLGQVVEHMQPIVELPRLLGECWRMLKPGGKVRITTPDLDVLLNAYWEGKMDDFAHEQPEFYMQVTPDAQLSYIMFGACGPACTTENYEGHMACLGKRHAKALLEVIGFTDVTFDAKSDVFAECVDAGMSHSWAAEATKP